MTDLINSILHSPLIVRTGWTLVHSVWQIAIIAIVLVALLRILARRDPRHRYMCCLIALLTCTLLPAITFCLTHTTPPAGAFPPLAASHVPPPFPHPQTSNSTTPQPPLPKSFTQTPTPTPLPSSPTASETRFPTSAQALPWIVLAWAVGVIILSLWNLFGWITLRHLRSRSTQPVSPSIIDTAARLSRRLNLTRPVQILQSALATTPLVLRALRPVILLPISVLIELSAAELESIFAHELAHVRRHDYLANLLQSVIETLLFYHPAVWWISRQMRIEREHCCDDLALSVTRDRATYATALAAVASIRVPTLAPAATGGKLLPRLRRILGIPDSDSARPSRGLAGAIVAACLIIAMVVPHLQLKAKAADKATQNDDVIVVRGRVLDPNGNPASGAKVAAAPAWPFRLDESHPAVIATATTSPDGRFQISFKKSNASAFSLGNAFSGADLWKKTQIVASADGLGLDFQQFDHVNSAGDLELKLIDDVPLKGRILDLEGHPVPAVSVTVAGLSSHILTDNAQLKNRPENFRALELPLAASGNDRTILTDADGRFQITGLGKERLATLEFRADTIAIPNERVMTRQGPPLTGAWGSGDRAAEFKYYGSTFELAASPARIATGIIRDGQSHEPIPNARVEVFYGLHERKTVTDAQGRYRLAGLERDRNVELRVFTDDRPYIPMIVTVPDAAGVQPVTVDVELFKGVWITGRVTDLQTKAAILTSVDYLPLASNQYAAKVPVFRQGWAQPPCYSETRPDGAYRVIAAPGPGVIAVRTSSSSYMLGQGFDAIKSKNQKGDVATLLPQAVHPTWYTAAKEIDAAPDGITENVDFTLDPGGAVHITCVDPDGKPLGNIQVQGTQAGNGAMFAPFENAQFDAVGLRSDEARLIHIKDDQRHLAKAQAVRLADAKNGNLTITLQPVAYVTGHFLTPQRDPITGGSLRVDATSPEFKDAHRVAVGTIRTGPDGRFKLELPPNVRLIIGASPSPYGGIFKWVTQDLKLAPGQTKDLGDIELGEDMVK